jgi:glycosyltransferase involved in cell wall biosynthesis
MRLKILHISGTYLGDGATSSIINLNNHLIKNNITSIFYLLKSKKKCGKQVLYLNINFFFKLKFFIFSKFESIVLKLFKKNKSFAFFNNIVESDALQIIKKKKPDIVHLHWIPRVLDIKKISDINAKIIITMRDYWLITGGCNYPVNCIKFKDICNSCPHLKDFGFNKDISYFNFTKKRMGISKNKKNLNIVVPNLQMLHEVKQLNIFDSKNIFFVPNGIEVNEFFPTNKTLERSKLSIKHNKKIILFGAQNLNQEWKGIETVIELSKVIDRDKYSFLSFGYIDPKIKKKISENIEYIDMGYVSEKNDLRSLYNAADFFVFSSLIETFGKVILESIFCGTPVIAFNQYAARDIITHGVDGYLVDSNKASDFRDGIYFLEQNSSKEKLKNECISKVEKYSMEAITQQYISLYKSI